MHFQVLNPPYDRALPSSCELVTVFEAPTLVEAKKTLKKIRAEKGNPKLFARYFHRFHEKYCLLD